MKKEVIKMETKINEIKILPALRSRGRGGAVADSDGVGVCLRLALFALRFLLLALTADCTLLTADLFAQQENTISNDGTTSKFWSVGYDSSARLGIGLEPGTAITNMLTLKDSGTAGSQSFISGWQAGSGWKIDADSSKRYMLTIDDITVRGTLSVYELLINQIRATNGNLLVTSSATVDSVAKNQASFWAEDVTENNIAPFVTGDIIICQGANMAGATFDASGNVVNNGYLVKRLIYIVSSVSGRRVYVSAAPGAPAQKKNIKVGDVFCRIGNTSNGSRMGLIGLYADEAYSPYLRVTDSVASWADWNNPKSIRVQLGKLTGITDEDFGGQLEGYGLYATNVYLKGKIVLTNPEDYNISMSNAWDSLTNKPTIFNAPAGKGLFLSATNMGYYNNTDYPSDPWRTYMDNQGRLYLKGSGTNYFSWNGSALTMRGDGNQLDISSNSTISGINNTLTTFGTSITNNTNAITLRAYTYTTDSLRNRISTAETGINLNASNMLLYAKKDSIISKINLTPEGIKISASKIQIDGTTTFASGYNPADKLSAGQAASDINNNTTTINGGKITTGTITADRLNVSSISAISANLGTITAGTISGLNITGATITGGTIQTSTSGQRVVISSDVNDIKFYGATGLPIQVNAGGDGILQISNGVNIYSGANLTVESGYVKAAGYRTNDGYSGASATTGGLTFKYGLYVSGSAGDGSGTVTSVAMSVPAAFTVSGGPITSSGTLVLGIAGGYAIPTTAQVSNWNTAYTDRLKWDGGSTGLNAATGRSSLGLGTMALENIGAALENFTYVSELKWSGTTLQMRQLVIHCVNGKITGYTNLGWSNVP
jgi:hypothetical protein